MLVFVINIKAITGTTLQALELKQNCCNWLSNFDLNMFEIDNAAYQDEVLRFYNIHQETKVENVGTWKCEFYIYKDVIELVNGLVFNVLNSTHILQCARAHECIGYHWLSESVNENLCLIDGVEKVVEWNSLMWNRQSPVLYPSYNRVIWGIEGYNNPLPFQVHLLSTHFCEGKINPFSIGTLWLVRFQSQYACCPWGEDSDAVDWFRVKLSAGKYLENHWKPAIELTGLFVSPCDGLGRSLRV